MHVSSFGMRLPDTHRSTTKKIPPPTLRSRSYSPSIRASTTFTATATTASTRTTLSQPQREQKKLHLLSLVAGTQRGSDANLLKRGSIEEAQVALECTSPPEVDWSLLPGTWDVVYTTASDVVPIVRNENGFPLRVGRVGQRFSSVEEGIVHNLIEVEAVLPVLNGSKATLVVEATYEVRTSRSIALRFQKVGVGRIEAGDDLQNALAPPLLPRGMFNLQALMALQDFSAYIPLTTRAIGVDSGTRRTVGVNYSITYLDEDVFIGRAQGGTFIFVKRQ